MHSYAEIAAAAHRVRCRYEAEDLADLFLNRLVDETRRELDCLERERLAPTGNASVTAALSSRPKG